MTDPFGARYVYASSAGVFEFKDGVGTRLLWNPDLETNESDRKNSSDSDSKLATLNGN